MNIPIQPCLLFKTAAFSAASSIINPISCVAGMELSVSYTHLLQYHFFGQPLIDDVTQSLGTRLRRKGKAALFHILHLAHNVQRKCVNTQGRQGYIHAFALEFVNEEIDQAL